MSFDADAQDYIDRVIAVDGFMWPHVQEAINRFVVGCKADASPFSGVSNWDAIKACCLMVGHATLEAALVPLKGPAPSNVGFVDDDYHQVLGLKGDGSTKHVATGRLNADDPQDNFHACVFATEFEPGNLIGVAGSSSGATSISTTAARCRTGNFNLFTASVSGGFIGVSRSSPEGYWIRRSKGDQFASRQSQSPNTDNREITVFANNVSSGITAWTASRMLFYSVGEAVDLVSLDARVTQFMRDIQMPNRRGFPMSRLVN